ncbi:hypothetical protein [Photobacterium carnosum]|uniref:hypothetical protein n=1 Tax=Photobacterium carnosum TaxID=2023717 RepID=UPI001E49CC70|nr:hypothetical protein [Photobacterium carnosum]MCD9526138.1 hypothetical protein [Photobacterium carnosum]
METLKLILSILGGSTVVISAAAYLARILLKSQLDKDLADHKSALSRESNEVIERLKHSLLQDGKHEDRFIGLKLIMQSYKGPLLHASYELQSRIYNLVSNRIIELYFKRDIGDGSEKEYLINNTVFVISQYFAWTEIIRREIQFIEMDNPDETKVFSHIQDEINTLWNSDKGRFDDPLMIWSGEQRGIGELMIEAKEERLTCIGYSNFLKLLETKDEYLLNQLKAKVEKYIYENDFSKNRLVLIQNTLIDLLAFLDPDYKRFPHKQREKII